jgi:transcriptional regulator with XRE-family HTH domain
MSSTPSKIAPHFPAVRPSVADVPDLRRQIADRLRHERETKSLSRENLAYLAGISPKTIKRLEEQQVANPRPVTIRKLAEALEIDPARLRPPEELEADQLARIERRLGQIMHHLGLRDSQSPEELADETSARANDALSEARRKAEPNGQTLS